MAAGNTYTPIATTTLGSSTASVTFGTGSPLSGNIPQTYTDLILVINGKSSSGVAGYVGTQFNGDTTALYSTTRLLGDGATATSDRYLNQTIAKGGTLWSSQGTVIHQIQNYSNTTTYKTFLTRDNNAGNRVGAAVSLYRSTNAITSIVLSCPDGSGFASGSIFTLYGISAA